MRPQIRTAQNRKNECERKKQVGSALEARGHRDQQFGTIAYQRGCCAQENNKAFHHLLLIEASLGADVPFFADSS
jgi:hypothetical protein